jgi:hypothetical protein
VFEALLYQNEAKPIACYSKNQVNLNAAYAQGYQAGLKQRPEVAKETQNLNRNSHN